MVEKRQAVGQSQVVVAVAVGQPHVVVVVAAGQSQVVVVVVAGQYQAVVVVAVGQSQVVVVAVAGQQRAVVDAGERYQAEPAAAVDGLESGALQQQGHFAEEVLFGLLRFSLLTASFEGGFVQCPVENLARLSWQSPAIPLLAFLSTGPE